MQEPLWIPAMSVRMWTCVLKLSNLMNNLVRWTQQKRALATPWDLRLALVCQRQKGDCVCVETPPGPIEDAVHWALAHLWVTFCSWQ